MRPTPESCSTPEERNPMAWGAFQRHWTPRAVNRSSKRSAPGDPSRALYLYPMCPSRLFGHDEVDPVCPVSDRAKVRSEPLDMCVENGSESVRAESDPWMNMAKRFGDHT